MSRQRYVYTQYANQDEANRQFAGRLNEVADDFPYVGALTITSATELDPQFGTYLADASGGAFTATVPPAAPHENKGWTVKKIDSSGNAVTLSSSDNIDGSTTYQLTSQYEAVTITSDGSQWHITMKV